MDTTFPTLAPLPDWSEIGESDHFVQFYETEDFLVDRLTSFLSSALRAGDAGVVIATPARRDGLDERLRADGLDMTALTASGQYISLDAAELLSALMPAGSLEPERFTEIVGGIIERAGKGGRRVRAFGEMVALLWADGNYAAALELEQLWNDLQKTRSFSLICGYPMAGFAGEPLSEALGEVCAEHSRVVPAESYAALADLDERLRAVALLQQKAGSLEAELANRKRTEEALRESQDALHRSLLLRDEFLSDVSHDLKTPLTVLQGQAQLLQWRMARGTLDEEALRKALDQIESRSRLMAQLIDERLIGTRSEPDIGAAEAS